MISITGNINLDPVQKYLPKNTAVMADYNQYRFELVNKQSVSRSSDVQYVFIFLLADVLFMPRLQSATERKKMQKLWEEHVEMFQDFLEVEPGKTLIIADFGFSPFYVGTDLNMNSEFSLFDFEFRVNNDLRKLSMNYSNCIIMEWKRIFRIHGFENLVNRKGWFMGRIPFIYKFYELLSKELLTMTELPRKTAKKVLVLDLDNTLWGGIVGEVGLNGINLSEDGVGKAYRDFQRTVLAIKDLGVLFCLCSKNNEEDAKEVFDQNHMMILKWDDFVCKKINWENKAGNISAIARELNLGLDSIVFIDDNPLERSQVKEILPEVTVPDFPDDPMDLVHWFYEHVVYKYFRKIILTNEDINKDTQYLTIRKRAHLQKKMNMETFFKELNISLTVYFHPTDYIARLCQMTHKTNQFNLMTNRWSEVEIRGFMKSPDHIVCAGEYEDRFGLEGIIVMAVIHLDGRKAYIKDLLMSCRMLCRNVEFLFLKAMLKTLESKNVEEIIGLFRPTKKNIPVKDFYSSLKMTEISAGIYSGNIVDLITVLGEYDKYGEVKTVFRE